MRTARAIVVLTGNARPASHATFAAATDTLDAIAEGAARIGPIRFVGYTPATQVQADVPASARCATYEADYVDT